MRIALAKLYITNVFSEEEPRYFRIYHYITDCNSISMIWCHTEQHWIMMQTAVIVKYSYPFFRWHEKTTLTHTFFISFFVKLSPSISACNELGIKAIASSGLARLAFSDDITWNYVLFQPQVQHILITSISCYIADTLSV